MPPTGLLAFRLSPDGIKTYVAESRKPPLGYYESSDTDIHPSKLQAIVVRGFDADAVAVIGAANEGKGTALSATYCLGQQMHTVVRQVEDMLRVPSEHWRLTPKTRLCGVNDSLTSPMHDAKPQSKPIELLLISQSAVPLYLAQHEYMRDWKRLQPAPPPPGSPANSLAQALATWHLLSPGQDEHWARYAAQRRNAEWSFAQMSEQESLSLTVPPFLDKIKDGRTGLTADEQAVVADGILPRVLEVWDDGSDGVYLEDVTALAHVFSPTRPAMLDVFLHYPSPCNIRILYRLHDPAPLHDPSGTFRVRSRGTHPQHGIDGWRPLFEMNISSVPKRTRRGTKDVERRTWGLTRADALKVHDALFGIAEAAEADAVGAKVSVLDAVLLVLAAVGFHMELKQGKTGEAALWDEDRFACWEGPNWKLDKLEWTAGNLRTVCGVTLDGDNVSVKEVVEDDSDW